MRRQRNFGHMEYCIEHRIGIDDNGNPNWVEYEYKIEILSYYPYDPGVCSGPVESCYPPEGGEAEWDEDSLQRRRTNVEGAKWEAVPYSILIEGIIDGEGFQDDPSIAHDKAEEHLQAIVFNHCEEAAEGAYEDAMERKGEEMRERMMEGDDW
jgi:hypothetical protein